ncbi:iron-containing alcohol dehydrogenase [Albidovulum sp.]|uniref:iron-containing alcohol dehydrogenase n=1 Tax=Albidovulum sp. TaxID=1872424 RepID=UPI0039B930B5
MTPFAVAQPGRIRFGRGEARAALPEIAGFGRRAFVVHGRASGRADWLAAGLGALGLSVTPHPCPREPTLSMLEAAVAAAEGAEVVIALGGGAAIDLGKAVAALVPVPGGALDHLEVVGRGLPLERVPLPFVAMPTTAGTGAEATRNAVIDAPERRRKVSLRDDRMIARLAVVDPWLSTRATPYTDALCRAAIPMGLAALRWLMAAEDAAARDAMAWVSLSGGLALSNAGLGAGHGLAGVVGGMTGAAHGAICGALLPHALRANAARAPSAGMAEVQGWIGAAFGAADGIAALEDWMHAEGLPRLSAPGLGREDHPTVADAARGASSMRANPAALSPADLAAILAAAG